MPNSYPTTHSVKNNIACVSLTCYECFSRFIALCVHHLDLAGVPEFQVSLVTNLYELVHGIFRSSLEVNRINTHKIMWPFLTVCDVTTMALALISCHFA